MARSPNRIDVEFLPKGLHDIGQAGMSARLAEVLAAVDESKYDALLLGYALCSNGVVGLGARSIPLVIPRGHDCITFFFGSKERYLDYFRAIRASTSRPPAGSSAARAWNNTRPTPSGKRPA